jgi:UDP-glucose:(heptosyl)LPS alpha-1,3-glucosyltransferase
VLAAKGRSNADNIHILCGQQTGRRTSLPLFAKAVRQYTEKNSYDILHSVIPLGFENVYQPPGGSFAEAIIRNAASYQNKFLVFYKMATAFINWRRREMLLAEKRLCKNPGGPIVAALSNYVKDQFKMHYNLEDERIAVIPNGVEVDIRENADCVDKLRSQIFCSLKIVQTDKPVFFLFAANNFRLKGLDTLIRAFALLKGSNLPRQPYLLVAGNDKPNKYHHLADKLNVHDKVVFLGPVEHIQNVLSISDVAVLPTFYDPSSRVILEALAADKPVITTKFNGAADLFTNNRHGLVIDKPENTVELAKAIGYFTHPENIQKAKQAIISDNLKEKVSIERAAKQLLTVYESILKRRGL